MNTTELNQKATRAAEPFAGFDERVLQPLLDRATEAGRRKAFEAYRLSAAPTARSEHWRRSPHDLLQPPAGAALQPAVYPATDEVSSVLRVSPFGIVAEGHPVAGASLHVPSGAALLPGDTHRRFNRAFWNAGLRLRVAAGCRAQISLLLDLAGAEALWMPRIEIELAEGAELTIEERTAGRPKKPAQIVVSREYNLSDGAILKTAFVNTSAYHVDWVVSDSLRLGRDAHVEWLAVQAGGRHIKSTLEALLAEPGAEADLRGMVLGDRKRHVDQRILQWHAAANTVSKSLYRAALGGDAYSVYQGMIDVRPDCNGVDAYQTNNNLLLSSAARADSIPGLEIESNDLRCSHGSTSGQPDPEQVFYLQTRGLNAIEARKMIVSGFLEPIIERVSDALREHVRACVDQYMENDSV